MFSPLVLNASQKTQHFYTGFPDYETLIAFWNYIEPSASHLTYYSSVRDATQANTNDVFPFLNTPGKKFPGRNVGAQRSLQPIDKFWLLLTRLRLGLFERDLGFRFNISISTVSDIMITYSNHLFVMLGSLPMWGSKDVIKQHLLQPFKEDLKMYAVSLTALRLSARNLKISKSRVSFIQSANRITHSKD